MMKIFYKTLVIKEIRNFGSICLVLIKRANLHFIMVNLIKRKYYDFKDKLV